MRSSLCVQSFHISEITNCLLLDTVGKHVTEEASKTASSFTLFKPASLLNIKEADTGAHLRTQSVKQSGT